MTSTKTQTQDTGIPPKPADAKFKKPVAWLLGPQLVASLKWVILYAIYKGKVDPRDWMQTQEFDSNLWPRLNTEAGNDEFWFDYFSDTGDGQKAMYTIAYLCLSKLWTEPSPRESSEVAFDHGPNHTMLLPRGEFLFVGGDSSYHVADYASLASRFQAPIHWAFNDLKENGKISENEPRRPIFGIPGNHDYYDMIDGFHRQFCKPVCDEDTVNEEGLKPQLMIPGFKRYQTTSYVAIKLPFEWWLWGLDNESGDLNICQKEFFKKLNDGKRPDKLIVATPEPTTVMGKRATKDDKTARAFGDLDLDQPFLADGALPAHKCRLDLSGDVHHYARYWGPDSKDGSSGNKKQAPSANNYASIVSGLGGAFFHPSHTDVNEVQEQTLYPRANVSRRKVAEQIFNPLNVIRGGYVSALGALMAAIIYFAATVPKSTRPVVDNLLHTLFRVAPYPEGWLASLFPALVPPSPDFAQSAGITLAGMALRVVLLIFSIIFIVMSVSHSKWLIDLRPDEKARSRMYSFRVIALMAAALVCLAIGVWDFVRYRASLSSFESSLMVLFCLLWAGAAVVASIVYSEWLFKQAAVGPVSKLDYWPVWALVILAAIILCSGVFLFGRYPLVYLFPDIIFASIVFGALVSLTVLAVFVGGSLHRALGRAGFGVLGAWHALLQIAVAFLLVRVGSPWAWGATVPIALAFAFIGIIMAKRNMRFGLLAAWIVYGALLLYLPFLLPASAEQISSLGMKMLRYPVVILLGGLMSAIWLGWYFAVSLAFNGHNSEAGGAARIEDFKEFIRFRLTEDGLTGYVIGVDRPEAHGKKLRPRIVDVFELKRQRRV
jgi:hypothetical protein